MTPYPCLIVSLWPCLLHFKERCKIKVKWQSPHEKRHSNVLLHKTSPRQLSIGKCFSYHLLEGIWSYNVLHPKKVRMQGTNWKDPCPRKQKNHLRLQTTRRTSSSWTPPSCCKKHIKEGKGRSQDLLKGGLAWKNPHLLQQQEVSNAYWIPYCEIWVLKFGLMHWIPYCEFLGLKSQKMHLMGNGVQVVSFIKADDSRLNSASRDVPMSSADRSPTESNRNELSQIMANGFLLISMPWFLFSISWWSPGWWWASIPKQISRLNRRHYFKEHLKKL